MNKENITSDQTSLDLDLPDLTSMSTEQIKRLLIEERQRFLVAERDLFKSQTEGRRMNAQIKALQEINTLNAKNRNNTSSAFTLPSEFKSAWDVLVNEHILDAFPDFLDKYEELIPLVQELFISVRQEIVEIQRGMIMDVGKRMKLIDDKSD
jgi:hypothetical protein